MTAFGSTIGQLHTFRLIISIRHTGTEVNFSDRRRDLNCLSDVALTYSATIPVSK
jgi:hypothetical protein